MSEGLEAFEGDSKIVNARGTENGLVLRIDGRADWGNILTDVEAYLCRRKEFFQGGEVAVEWLDRLPTKEQSSELEALLKEEYDIGIAAKKKKSFVNIVDEAAGKEEKKSSKPIPLFQAVEPEKVNLREQIHIEKLRNENGIEVCQLDDEGTVPAAGQADTKSYLDRVLGDEVFYDEDANAKILFGTLRSGQRIETPFSLVVIGDVNPGADLIAGGDIVVLGSLRGTAHASAYDDDTPDRVIVALSMQPIQLRIGSVISRGSDEIGQGAEIARIEDRRIVVEVFNPRLAVPRKLR